MNRLGLLWINDVIDDIPNYLLYLLTRIVNEVDELIVVSKSLKSENVEKLKEYADRICFEPSIISLFINNNIYETIDRYDEMVIFDDSFYGPLYPLNEVFSEMNNRGADYWGITKRAESINDIEHLELYFVVIRERMLHSLDFRKFWEEAIKVENATFDSFFSSYFKKCGYTYDSYVNDDWLNSSRIFNYNHNKVSPYTMVKNNSMPFVRRETFVEPKDLYLHAGEEIPKVLKYIRNNLGYDTDMIWEDILKRGLFFDIKNNINLNYVIPVEKEYRNKTAQKTVVIAHITYEELVDECLSYLLNVPEYIDIVVTSYKTSVLDKIKEVAINRNIKTMLVENRGRDVAAIFVGCNELIRKYDYICFVHDKRTTGNKGSYPIGASFNSLVWDNTLASSDYIEGIINLFDSEKKLGFLSPPKPLHWDYRTGFVDEWTVNMEKTKSVAKKIGLDIQIDKYNKPFCLSTCFWCKKDALIKIWDAGFQYNDFPEEPCPMDGELNHCLERILVFAAQDAGYYSAVVENDEYASLDLQNREIWLRKLFELNSKSKEREVLLYSTFHEKIYVYGAGIEAHKVNEIIANGGKKVEGFIVSDNLIDSCVSDLKPIIRLSEVPLDSEVGIVVGMNLSNSEEVQWILKEQGFQDVLFFNRKGDQI